MKKNKCDVPRCNKQRAHKAIVCVGHLEQFEDWWMKKHGKEGTDKEKCGK